MRVYQFRHIRVRHILVRALAAPAHSIARLRRALFLSAATATALLWSGAAASAPSPSVEVVVGLGAPSLTRAVTLSRAMTATAKTRRLDLDSATSASYLRSLSALQRTVVRRIERTIPSARVTWRYQVVLDALAVVVPRDRVGDLSKIPGVATVYPNVRYRAALDRSPELVGADQLWGLPDFTTAGNGVKIGIIDDGLDQTHPFFDPTGYTYPPDFPKGDTAYTTPKVIVARAFVPPTTTWKYARLPFDPVYSEHGTHVGGIAAGDYSVGAVSGRGPLSGVAPRAYIGNYKMDSTPFGSDLIENSVELAAAIEAAVRDGMDVINISFGEIEVDHSHGLVDQAVDAAADAGVVPVIAAGNEFQGYGRGSVSSPGSAAKAITVAAASKSDVVAFFSSSGPTPISLQLKPDVTAPGVSILSSVPRREGTWTQFSGTSMAAPHVAGAAALLRQRHPDWTVEQIKSALVLTGDPVFADTPHTLEVPTTREGGGLVNLPRADNPRVFASPTNLSFGLLRRGGARTLTIDLSDAGGGAGEWSVSVQPQASARGVSVTAPVSMTVPGALVVQATTDQTAGQQDATGFVVLSNGQDVRRIPYWLRAEAPRLEAPAAVLTRSGDYEGNTQGKPARVTSYRYPDDPRAAGVASELPGPEQVFRIRFREPVTNFGVVVLSQGRGVRVTPRLVVAGDENRLLGYRALPLNVNPYLRSFGRVEPVVGAVTTPAGAYDVVFDTAGPGQAGPFTFRLWIDDTIPPAASLVSRVVELGEVPVVAVSDDGSGVDPASLSASVDGVSALISYSAATGEVRILAPKRLRPGLHKLVLLVSDYQESKNSESVRGILPNTRVLRAKFRVTR